MMYRTIQGQDVPSLGFGTWLLRGDACRAAVEHALDLGYRHVDTAQSYENEAEVGQALQAAPVDREEIFLTTKVWRNDLEPQDVRRSTEESLRRLRTDYVDLLLVHWPNESVPLESTLDAMLELAEAGRTRRIGVSNFPPDLLRRALDHAPVFCDQVEYHPYLGQEQLLDMAREHDLLVTAYTPIARGEVIQDETLREIGASHGKSPVQVTLRWLVQQPHVAAIPKASSAEHRASNLDIFDFELSDEEMESIFALHRDARLVDPAWSPWRG